MKAKYLISGSARRAARLTGMDVNTPFKEYFEVLMGTYFKLVPLLLDKRL